MTTRHWLLSLALCVLVLLTLCAAARVPERGADLVCCPATWTPPPPPPIETDTPAPPTAAVTPYPAFDPYPARYP